MWNLRNCWGFQVEFWWKFHLLADGKISSLAIPCLPLPVRLELDFKEQCDPESSESDEW